MGERKRHVMAYARVTFDGRRKRCACVISMEEGWFGGYSYSSSSWIV